MNFPPGNPRLIDTATPEVIDTLDQLEELLSRPNEGAVDALSRVEGDLMILGAGGKMGPSLARMARRALEAAGLSRRVFAVNRSFSPRACEALESQGIEAIEGDLLDPAFLESLPDAPNVIYMAGRKFGSFGNEPLLWALNTYLPSLVCRKFRSSRIVAFSTGNVYGMVPVESGGSLETDPPRPRGEYAMSCLGRERMFEYFSKTWDVAVTIIRLNYAVEMRYGVLVDLAQKVHRGQVVNLTMGYVNVIWQGDALATTLCALDEAASPARFLNVAGPELLRVRDVCEQFGRMLGKSPRLVGVEAPEALLNNGAQAHRRFGLPRISAEQMMRWIVHWIASGKSILDKPTNFEVRDGVF